GANGQQVTTREVNDLIHLAEARAHDLRLVIELLEVLVNPRDGRDSRILIDGNVPDPVLLPVPVINPPDEGRDQRHAGFRTGDGLGKAEEECQVAMNPFAFQLFRGPNAFPRAGNFDQNPLATNPGILVHADQLAGLGQRSLGVKTKAGIDLSGDTTGNDLEDLATEG